MNHDKFKHTTSVYVVGLSQTGGCWSAQGHAYESFDHAMAEVDADRAKGHKDTKVFTFNVYRAKAAGPSTYDRLQQLIAAATYMVNTVDANGPIQTAAGDLAVALAVVMTPEQYAAWKRSRPS